MSSCRRTSNRHLSSDQFNLIWAPFHLNFYHLIWFKLRRAKFDFSFDQFYLAPLEIPWFVFLVHFLDFLSGGWQKVWRWWRMLKLVTDVFCSQLQHTGEKSTTLETHHHYITTSTDCTVLCTFCINNTPTWFSDLKTTKDVEMANTVVDTRRKI